MGLATYVVNFDELVQMMAIDGVTVDLDTSEIERILERYFPELIDILNKLAEDNEIKGTQRIKGFVTQGSPIVYTPPYNIVITGLTFSQDHFDGFINDRWNVVVSNGREEITLIDGIYAKNTLQHKHFERFYPVPKGYDIIIKPVTSSGVTYWADLEYVEIAGEPGNLISNDFADWESGHYGTNGVKGAFPPRIRLIELFHVPHGQLYFNTRGDRDSLRFIIRVFNTSGVFMSNLGDIANGYVSNFSASVGYLGISIYDNANSALTFYDFQNMFNNGTLRPWISIAGG